MSASLQRTRAWPPTTDGEEKLPLNWKQKKEPYRSAFKASLTSASCRLSCMHKFNLTSLFYTLRATETRSQAPRSATCGLMDSVATPTKKASDAGFCCSCEAPRWKKHLRGVCTNDSYKSDSHAFRLTYVTCHVNIYCLLLPLRSFIFCFFPSLFICLSCVRL